MDEDLVCDRSSSALHVLRMKICSNFVTNHTKIEAILLSGSNETLDLVNRVTVFYLIIQQTVFDL